jgi:molybdopterin converting factor small subunit
VELTEGEKVSKIMDAFGITEEEAKIVFVNHRISDVDKLLKDGDRVSLFPATGGM